MRITLGYTNFILTYTLWFKVHSFLPKAMAGSCAAIRKVVSWEELELIISKK